MKIVDALAIVIDLADGNALDQDTTGELEGEAKKQHEALQVAMGHLTVLRRKDYLSSSPTPGVTKRILDKVVDHSENTMSTVYVVNWQDKRLKEDLNMDDLDLVGLVMDIGKEFGVHIDADYFDKGTPKTLGMLVKYVAEHTKPENYPV